MRSNAASAVRASRLNASACTKRTRRPAARHCGVRRRVPAARSTAVTRASGISRARLTAMQPLPVPRRGCGSGDSSGRGGCDQLLGFRDAGSERLRRLRRSCRRTRYAPARIARGVRRPTGGRTLRGRGCRPALRGATTYCVSVMPHRSKVKRRAICLGFARLVERRDRTADAVDHFAARRHRSAEFEVGECDGHRRFDDDSRAGRCRRRAVPVCGAVRRGRRRSRRSAVRGRCWPSVFTAARTTSSLPLVMPPAMPPAWLVAVRPSASAIGSLWAEPRRAAAANPSPNSTP